MNNNLINQNDNYYICIGASAGGLEPLKTFFRNIPEETSATIFILQHHSSSHESMLDQILRRETKLPIQVVTDNMATFSKHIYIIPAGQMVSIYHGRIYFIEDRDKDYELPIDHFFGSLALDQKEYVIGIILSGTGKDGSLGMKAIQKNGGHLIVQSKESSQFYDMPNNSSKENSVDYFLEPKKMPSKILEIIKTKNNNYHNHKIDSTEDFSVDLMKICHIIRRCSGIDFSNYKEEMIKRRVKIRMNLLDIRGMNEYINVLNSDLKERISLFNSLTVASKSFFEDEDFCNTVENKILPNLNYNENTIRIWSVGCSTGEEVYSLTILLLEFLRKNNIHLKVKVFATDIDEEVLDSSREGIYKKEELQAIDKKIMNDYFEFLENGVQVIKRVREMIVFAKHDLLKDPPFSNVDLINCRNVLMNYNNTAQKSILSAFHYGLNADGFLIIGKKESLGQYSSGFKALDEESKIFAYEALASEDNSRELTALKNYTIDSQSIKDKNLKVDETSLKNQALMQSLVETQIKSGVLIDSNYKILQVFNDVHPYLKIGKGRFSNNFFTNISSDLALVITNGLEDLENKCLEVTANEVKSMNNYDDFLLRINRIQVEKESFYLITFDKIDQVSTNHRKIVTDFSKINFNHLLEERIAFLERELLQSQNKAFTQVEELEEEILELNKNNQDLILSNEKLQTINEELYSINDEYEKTMKEQFSSINNLNVLINSMPLESIHLDENLNIVSISSGVSKYTHLINKDIGRNIEHLVVNKNYPDFIKDLKQVLKTSEKINHIIHVKEKEIMFRMAVYSRENTKGVIIIIINIDDL